MDLEQKMLIKQQGIDKINEDIVRCLKSREELVRDIQSIKQEVRLENYHLLGRDAFLVKHDGSECEGNCSDVEVGDDLKIKCFFSYGSKKIKDVKSYKFK